MTSRHTIILIALLLFCASGLMADQFDLSATGADINMNLILVGTQSMTSGIYSITSISGMVDGSSVAIYRTTLPEPSTNTLASDSKSPFSSRTAEPRALLGFFVELRLD